MNLSGWLNIQTNTGKIFFQPFSTSGRKNLKIGIFYPEINYRPTLSISFYGISGYCAKFLANEL